MANEVTSVQVAQAIAKIVAGRALPPLVGNLVMGQLVNRDFEQTLGQIGDTVNVTIPPTMTANNLAEAGTVQNQNPSLGNAQIVLNTHAEVTFQIPDAVRVLTTPDVIDVYMGPAIIALAERIETDLLSTYTLFTANTALGAGTTFDEARLDSAEKALADAKVPANERKFLVASTSAYSAIRTISRFSEYQMTGPSGQPSPMITGLIGGTLKGLEIYRSQYVSAVSTTYHNLAFTRNAIGLVMRRLPQPLPGTGAIAEYVEMGGYGFRVVFTYAAGTLAPQFTVDCLYGVGVLRNNHAVDVQST